MLDVLKTIRANIEISRRLLTPVDKRPLTREVMEQMFQMKEGEDENDARQDMEEITATHWRNFLLQIESM